jgi:HAD superfamily hydrolase (TIGR01490 family)
MKLALFDFDGTVTTCDSFLLFIRHAVGERKFMFGAAVLSPKILLYAMGRYPNYQLKQDFLTYFFGGLEEGEFNRAARRFSAEKIPGILRPRAMKRIQDHREQGDCVVLVSASLENTLTTWCRETGLDLLATRLEVIDGRITGRLQGKNCWGEEKVVRVKKEYNTSKFDEIYAYGDSTGDRAMLALADKSFYKFFQGKVQADNRNRETSCPS